MTASPFANWSDAQVLERLRAAADRCVTVVSMPDEERHRIGKKGEASPEQAGAFSAVVAFQLLREAESRGIS